MKKTDGMLPEWIAKQASLGPNISVEGKQTERNSFWYLLTLCCPLIFERYAIVLHPFWINRNLKKSPNLEHPKNAHNKSFERISWPDFFTMYSYPFDLQSANRNMELIRKRIIKTGWPEDIRYPNEGNCESCELEYILEHIKDIYGDIFINLYYCQLKTQNWEKEIIYQGHLTEFNLLPSEKEVLDNPTAIYPDNKSWCIVSDYDLPFTYIGGSKMLIDRITQNSPFDIYPIEPIFKAKNV